MDVLSGAGQTESTGRKRWDLTLLALLILTVIGGVVRFGHRDRPPLWIDECFTFWRVCGSYQDLVNTLRDDGFVPLHYELLWWIHAGMPIGHWRIFTHGIYLTPQVMRFVPALCGTLMIPTIFFAARQLLRRRASLIAAAFMACSAYGMWYSHDAKMYMPAWWLGTLATGCLLWWLRTRNPTAWLAWIAAGAAAAGFHIVTLLLLALAPIFLLTQQRIHWKQAVLLILGCLLIVSGPAGYYGTFNRWSEKSGGIVPGVGGEPAPDANWDASGLNWIGQRDSGGVEAVKVANTYLTAYEWDGSNEQNDFNVTPPRIRRLFVVTDCTLIGLLILGAMPWPAKWRGQTAEIDKPPEPWWRAAFWIILWIIFPVYGFFYPRSFGDAASPSDWLTGAAQLWEPHWVWLIALPIILAAAATRWRSVAIAAGAAAALLVVVVSILTATGELELASVTDVTLIKWTALIVLPASAWALSGETIRQRLIKLGQFIFMTGTVLLICVALHVGWDRLRADSMEKHPELPWQSIWETRYLGIVWPALWIGVAGLISRLPTRPFRILAIVGICGLNLGNGISRMNAQAEGPYDRIFADIWQSQDKSTTRTYFDLNEGLGSFMSGDGLPAGVYWRPIVSYDAALAGRVQTSPTDFRDGKTWPFNYGPMMARFQSSVAYRPSVSPDDISADLKKTPQVNRVIVWEMTHETSPAKDSLARELGPQWHLVHEETVQVWQYRTWTPQSLFRRREFVRGE